jgi:hypothetical protein
MLAGIELLKELEQKHTSSGDVLSHGVAIRTPVRGIELYQLAMDQYFGDVLLERLNRHPDGTLPQRLGCDNASAQSQWVDIAGMIAPKEAVDILTDGIKAGQINQISGIADGFEVLHKHYAEYEWAWVAHQLQSRLDKPTAEWQDEDIAGILKASLEASEKLTALQIEDANKEFALSSRIGYGIDGDSDTQTADFTAVCGSADTNATIQGLKEELEQKKRKVNQINKLIN